jgi:MFS transporter, SP family, general alpha glucoside:H+ symporter
MVHTVTHEEQLCDGTTYWSYFSSANIRRTKISYIPWAAQNLYGAGLVAYSTYFYENAGLPTDKAFDMSLALYAIGFFGTLFSWILISHFGRCTLYVGGLFSLCIILLVVGSISITLGASTIVINADGTIQSANVRTAWATGSMLLVLAFVYDCTVGPVCYSLVSEIPPTRVRNKTIVMARTLYNIIGIINGVIVPYMLNPTAWNWAGKVGFSGVACASCVPSGHSSVYPSLVGERFLSWIISFR